MFLLREGSEVLGPRGCCVERALDCRVQQPGLALLYPILVVHHHHQKQKQQLAHAMLIKDIKMRSEKAHARNVIPF